MWGAGIAKPVRLKWACYHGADVAVVRREEQDSVGLASHSVANTMDYTLPSWVIFRG